MKGYDSGDSGYSYSSDHDISHLHHPNSGSGGSGAGIKGHSSSNGSGGGGNSNSNSRSSLNGKKHTQEDYFEDSANSLDMTRDDVHSSSHSNQPKIKHGHFTKGTDIEEEVYLDDFT